MSVIVRPAAAPVPDPPAVYDAHCWVVRDGRIIDPWFPMYDLIAMIRGVAPVMVHKPAPPLVQQVMLGSLKSYLDHIVHMVKVQGYTFEPIPNNCFVNAAVEQALRGGTVVAGSLGFGSGGKVWWEFGGDTYTTVKDFKPKV
jgi:hypothetical protein